jgi:DNA-binding NarL/FixJ family response regulator
MPTVVREHVPVSVLLVSNDERIREGLRRPLERSGQVTVVGTAAVGDEVAELVNRASPEVILLDVHPGDEGALDLCRRLSRHAPVLLLSAFLTRSEWDEARAAGAADFHLKRIGVAELVQKVGLVRSREAPQRSDG